MGFLTQDSSGSCHTDFVVTRSFSSEYGWRYINLHAPWTIVLLPHTYSVWFGWQWLISYLTIFVLFPRYLLPKAFMLSTVVHGNSFSVTLCDSELEFLSTHLLCHFNVSRALIDSWLYIVTILSVSLFWTWDLNILDGLRQSLFHSEAYSRPQSSAGLKARFDDENLELA